MINLNFPKSKSHSDSNNSGSQKHHVCQFATCPGCTFLAGCWCNAWGGKGRGVTSCIRGFPKRSIKLTGALKTTTCQYFFALREKTT